MEVFALHHLVRVNRQVVAEVVEAQFSVGQIHHVTFVSLLSVRYLQYGAWTALGNTKNNWNSSGVKIGGYHGIYTIKLLFE
jgi:hypothetical protein